jgi:UDP-3-O-[3-hydroxymyristoyl] glucosamine N-acyltransferase
MKSEIEVYGKNVCIADDLIHGTNVKIHHCSYIGSSVKVGSNVKIGAFCYIDDGIILGDNCEIADYCAIYSGTKIKDNLKLLYGAKIFSNAKIGNNCIIGGDIPERTILEDDVSFLGEIAHSHRDASLDWDTTDEPSPVIKQGSIIGDKSLIVGGITIGAGCYIGAGETLRHDIPAQTVYYKGQIKDIKSWRGLIKTRFKNE